MTEAACAETRRRLALGEQTGSPDLAAHLASCSACRAEAERLAVMIATLSGDAEKRPDPGLDRRVRRMLTRPVPGRRWALRPVMATGLSVASVMALVAALGGLLAQAGAAEAGLPLAVAGITTYFAACFAATLPLLLVGRTRLSRIRREVQP